MPWAPKPSPERRLLIAASALLGMAQSLAKMTDSAGKAAYALSIARQTADIHDLATRVVLKHERERTLD